MRLRIYLILAIALLLGLPAPGRASLSVNEIMADPASDWDGDGDYNYRDDEWVELYNAGPGHVNLGEFMLGDDQGLRTFGWEDGEILSEGEAVAICGSQSLAWQQANGESSYGFALSNDGDCVVLWQVTADDTLLVDTHTFNTYEADDDRSSGRNPDGTGSWEIFDALNPYGGSTPPPGNGMGPTPGWPNLGDPPSRVGGGSWGDVKALFR